jgi:hypothetical protein
LFEFQLTQFQFFARTYQSVLSVVDSQGVLKDLHEKRGSINSTDRVNSKREVSETSLVRIEQTKPECYELRIKGFNKLDLIRAFAKQNDLTSNEDIPQKVVYAFSSHSKVQKFRISAFSKQTTDVLTKIKVKRIKPRANIHKVSKERGGDTLRY